jgi:5-methylcytosine-specific restriction endonuclease McrA
MNNIIKALLGTTYKPTNSLSNIQKPQITIDINPKPPRKPRKNNTETVTKTQPKVQKIEDPITEKEIQAAMKRIKKVEAEARKRLAEEELKGQNTTSKNTVIKSKAPKKQPIPNHVKTLIWNYHVGADKAESFCLCCKVTKISIRSFHAGHIIAESKGGDMTVKNLKPICGPCNHSMGSMNMDEFIKKFGLGK